MRHAPLVFTTKRRGKGLSNEPLQRLETIFRDLCADFDVELGEFNGGSDHLHLLVSYPPKLGISELVNSLKGGPSRRLKRDFASIKAFWSVKKSRRVLSTPSSFAALVARAPLCLLKQSIEQQTRPS